MDTYATNTPPQAPTALIFPAFRLGAISSDIIFWVPFLLIVVLILAVVVHNEMVFSFRLEIILVKVHIYMYVWQRDFKELAHNS